MAVRDGRHEVMRHWADSGPFDIIGDIHGCFEELTELLVRLGYTLEGDPPQGAHHPTRRVIFLGDVVDRGPGVVPALRLAMNMVAAGDALAVRGNHEEFLRLALVAGDRTHLRHGVAESIRQLADEPPSFLAQVVDYLTGLPAHLVLARGLLVCAHGGLGSDLHGTASHRAADLAINGDRRYAPDPDTPADVAVLPTTTGVPLVVHGHYAVTTPRRTATDGIDVDTGCVYGGALTALSYPEMSLTQVSSRQLRPPAPVARPAASTLGD